MKSKMIGVLSILLLFSFMLSAGWAERDCGVAFGASGAVCLREQGFQGWWKNVRPPFSPHERGDNDFCNPGWYCQDQTSCSHQFSPWGRCHGNRFHESTRGKDGDGTWYNGCNQGGCTKYRHCR